MNTMLQRRSSRWDILAAMVAMLALLTVDQAFAAKIKLETAVRQPSIVIGKPMLTWWDVRVEGPGIAVGNLEFVVKHNERVLSITQTDELTFSGSDQRIRVMLPGVRWAEPIDQLQVDVYFQTKSGAEKLEPQILRSPFMTKKVFIALVSDSRVLSSKSVVREKVLDQLKFEYLTTTDRSKSKVDDEHEHVKTIYAPIEATDFPTDPHSYCCYDVVILMGDELGSLKKNQLDALLAWVRAGGSLYVEPRGVLNSIHTDFLTSLAASDSQENIFQTDDSGQISRRLRPADEFAMTFECGVGVAVVQLSEPSKSAEDQDVEKWHSVAKSLWRVRKRPTVHPPAAARFLVANGGVPVRTIPQRTNRDPYGLADSAMSRTAVDHVALLERLKPAGVRMVPTWLLGLILFVMILLIGPVDYTLLGRLRLRKFTWITFPLITLSTTNLLVRTSDHFMSASEQLNSVHLHDVDSTGDIVRNNRFELIYPTSTRREVTEIQGGLFSSVIDPFQTQRLAGTMFQDRGGVLYSVVNGEFVRQNVTGVIEYGGRIPSRYSVAQNVMKWTPQLHRILEIPSSPTPTNVNWDAFRFSRSVFPDLNQHQIPEQLLGEVKKQFGKHAHCAAFFGTSGWFFDEGEIWRTGQVEESYRLNEAQKRQQLTFNFMASGEPMFLNWVHNASVAATAPGLLSLINHVSPSGDASCEDLLLLDSSDSRHWLIVVVVYQGNRYDIYRKQMTFAD